jgi:hypothetical protein
VRTANRIERPSISSTAMYFLERTFEGRATGACAYFKHPTVKMPLQGATAVTEGARLSKFMKSACYPNYTPQQGNPQSCCLPRNTVQAPITPSENSRIMTLSARCNDSLLNGGGVSQDRARQLLAAAGSRRQLVSEGVKIDRVIQEALSCTMNPDDPSMRFSMYERPEPPLVCPPLPPPPAPPLRECVLDKNQKFFTRGQ